MNLKFWTWFRKKKPKMVVLENSYRTEFFHLGYEGSPTSLCGAKVVSSRMPLSQWHVFYHEGTRWCVRCDVLRRKINLESRKD